jgi:hypothetical protein
LEVFREGAVTLRIAREINPFPKRHIGRLGNSSHRPWYHRAAQMVAMGMGQHDQMMAVGSTQAA